MTPEDYDRIQAMVNLPFGACPSATALRKNFPTVKTETWLAIYGQEQQYKVIRSHHVHKANVVNYLARYVSGEDVLQLSADVDFPPCMLLRRMLEKIIDAPKQAVGEVLRHPDRLDGYLCPGVPAPLLARLRADVVRCVHADCCYSPLSDVAKQVTGLEYELYLQQRLVQAGLPFWSESELRQLGFHKTPDCKLKVPVAVRTRSGSEHLVCWVDSKATFGDHRTHIKQVEEQYCTYVNRYGPGMVIYWFGFVEDLNTDPHVLLCDDFPDIADIVKITDSAAQPPAPPPPQQQQQQQQQQPVAGSGRGVPSGPAVDCVSHKRIHAESDLAPASTPAAAPAGCGSAAGAAPFVSGAQCALGQDDGAVARQDGAACPSLPASVIAATLPSEASAGAVSAERVGW